MVEVKETKQEAEQEIPAVPQWQSFSDDQALLKHIRSKKPAEELVDVPEWDTQLLCRALNGPGYVEVEMKAYSEELKNTDYRRVFPLVVLYGARNPATGNLFFRTVQDVEELDGPPVARLAMKILRLSRMLASDAERTKKN